MRQVGEDAVRFDPLLPRSKEQALAKIEMGHVVKVMLSFRSAFWEELCDGRYRDGAFFRTPESDFKTYWMQLPVRCELVTAWAGGTAATALRGVSPEELIERALLGFGEMFGEVARARREFVSAVAHDWQSDPFSRGAYSYVAAGGEGARMTLAEAVEDTLFFAGEATCDNGEGGTVNGALESGERAAREAAASLER